MIRKLSGMDQSEIIGVETFRVSVDGVAKKRYKSSFGNRLPHL